MTEATQATDDVSLDDYTTRDLDFELGNFGDAGRLLEITATDGHTWYATELTGSSNVSFDAGYTTLYVDGDRVTVSIDQPDPDARDGVTEHNREFRVIEHEAPEDVETDGGDELTPVSEEQADALEQGDVVEYEYESEDGDTKGSTGVVAKSNRGGIRVLVGDGKSRSLRVLRTTGVVNRNNARGNGHTTRKGANARLRRTGETKPISYVDRTGWVVDEPAVATDGGLSPEDIALSSHAVRTIDELREIVADRKIGEHDETR